MFNSYYIGQINFVLIVVIKLFQIIKFVNTTFISYNNWPHFKIITVFKLYETFKNRRYLFFGKYNTLYILLIP